MNLKLVSPELKRQLANESFTQNEINSFKYGNIPSEETRLKSALDKAFEIAKIEHYYLHSDSKYLKNVKQNWKFDTLDELENLMKDVDRFYN